MRKATIRGVLHASLAHSIAAWAGVVEAILAAMLSAVALRARTPTPCSAPGPDSPDLKPPMDDAAFAAAIGAHVQQIEQILSGDQAQWGQLIGEIKPVEPPPKKD
jgi:hypothetical protein